MKERTYQICVDGIEIAVTKKRMKNMYLRVRREDGAVLISAPHQMSDARIRAFAVERVDWIRKYQQKYAEARRRREEAGLYGVPGLCDGVPGTHGVFGVGEAQGAEGVLGVPGARGVLGVGETRGAEGVLGVPGTQGADVAGSGSAAGAGRAGADTAGSGSAPGTDIPGASGPRAPGAAGVPHAPDEAEIKRRKLLLKKEVERLVAKYEPRMGVSVSGITIRQMKTRWGSCNVRSHHININLSLLGRPPECLEYVVVHEMAHILEASHNQVFWGYVERFYPDYKRVRAYLRDEFA